jgi:hypothetical protein
MTPAHGTTVSARLKIVAPPIPAFFIASRSLVMPSREMLDPIHIHNTCGRLHSGGDAKHHDSPAPSDLGGKTLV